MNIRANEPRIKRKKIMAATITSAPFRLTKSSVFNDASNAKTRFQIRRKKNERKSAVSRGCVFLLKFCGLFIECEIF